MAGENAPWEVWKRKQMEQLRIQLETNSKQDTTFVGVDGNNQFGAMPFDNAEVAKAVLQWLRDVNEETRMRVFAAIVLEYQLAAHINDKTEKERLAALNMEQDGLIGNILGAVVYVSQIAHEGTRHEYTYVDITDAFKRLDELGLTLPPYVLYAVMKTIEECVPGAVVDLEEGYFKLDRTYFQVKKKVGHE